MSADCWTVQVYESGKWLGRLTPEGTTTRLTIYAAMFTDRAKAAEVAEEITRNPELPEITARVGRF